MEKHAMFSYEKFEAYKLSIKHWKTTLYLLDELPTGNSALKDQLKRASMSISINIAEGSGRNRKEDRKRFLAIARGSAMECAALLDLIVEVAPSRKMPIMESKQLLLSIVNILSSTLLR